ncbi:MAG: FAD binding domain-containing protein [Desulfobacula sp.]|nr:FAD binding domain-containing protein [Desulfobacula sp.]
MKPFGHFKSSSLDEASAILKEYCGKAKPVAGGTDFFGGLKASIHPQYPEAVVDLKTIENLSYIEEKNQELVLGSMTLISDIEKNQIIKDKFPLLADAASVVASPQIRNMGTLGGNICQEPRCWYYRHPDNTFNCIRKGGIYCNALHGDNRYHSIFGSMRVDKKACSSACPAGTDIPAYMDMIRKGKLDEAAAILLKKNPMPAITGRVCPHFCEENCGRTRVDENVSVRGVERFLGDYILENHHRIMPGPARQTNKTVAVVGSGPSGLATAYYLRCEGHRVVVFDKMDQPGGMLRYAIPDFRLPEKVVDRLISAFKNMGIEFRQKKEIGRNLEIKDLQKDYDALYLACGTWVVPTIGLKGEEHTVSGLDFLIMPDFEKSEILGRNTIVIGGGNVAVDAAVTAKRLGAKTVTMICLEKRDEMPANSQEVEQAIEEGINLMASWGPSKVEVKKGKVNSIDLVTCTSIFDKENRFAPVFDTSKLKSLKADMVIIAVGQRPDSSFLGSSIITSNGFIVSDPETRQTNVKGIYAGGDGADGPATVVEAVAAGQKAALAMNQFLGCGSERVLDEKKRMNQFDLSCLKMSHRQKGILKSAEKREMALEDLAGLSLEQISREANRCMNCGCVAVTPSDLAPVLVALDAKVITTKRILPAEEFFTAGIMSSTALENDELVSSIVIPVQENIKTAYMKFRIRNAIDFPIAGVAVVLKIVDGIIDKARIVLGAAAPMPLRVRNAEMILEGNSVERVKAVEAASLAVAGAVLLKHNGYKLKIIKAMVKRTILSALL